MIDNKSFMAHILWVYDDIDGPYSGLATYRGNNVWFSRITIPPMVSSTDIPVGESSSDSSERMYQLLTLSPSFLQEVRNDHIQYCQSVGYPINHGDAYQVRKPQLVIKQPTGAMEVEPRALVQVRNVVRQHSSNEILSRGQLVTTITESDFDNYYLPRQIST
jgi:hypothetical protein